MTKRERIGVCFLPWLTIPAPVLIGGFRFLPVKVGAVDSVIPGGLGKLLDLILSSHTDPLARPVQDATVITRPRHRELAAIPSRMIGDAHQASQLFALAALASQRHFERLSPYVNSTAFRPTFQAVGEGRSDGLSVFVPRRTGALGIGGLTYGKVIFQAPLAAYDVEAPAIDGKFARALDHARTVGTQVWFRLTEALPLFLLAMDDEQTVPQAQKVALAAISFDRLFGGLPVNGAALALGDEMEKLFEGFSLRTLADHPHITPDPRFAAVQPGWSVRRKWAKELYEARSDSVHSRQKADLSRNWSVTQHLVVASFVFPLAVKVLLRNEGHYHLTLRDEVSCDVLDDLLAAQDWGFHWKSRRNWPHILDMEVAGRELHRIVRAAYDKATTGRVEE